jgi:ZIP family zinc transporter
MSALRTFAVVAAAAIALLHLLPEAFAVIGVGAVIAALLGALGPSLLERAVPARSAHQAPTTSLAMGYAAVIVHQAGEGAALASLAETGALSVAIVLAIAAHTVPLAMVVAIRVTEVRRNTLAGFRRATGLALLGVASATAIGAVLESAVGGAHFVTAAPWILALVAGLLLHALAHDALPPRAPTLQGRLIDMGAGWAGLGLAALGVERGDWLLIVPRSVQALGLVVLAVAIAGRSLLALGPSTAHSEDH